MKDGYKNQATYIFKIVTWALSDHCPRDASRALDLWSPWVVYQGEDSTVTPQRPQCLTEALRGIIDPQRPSDDLWPTGHLHHTLYHHDITTSYLSWHQRRTSDIQTSRDMCLWWGIYTQRHSQTSAFNKISNLLYGHKEVQFHTFQRDSSKVQFKTNYIL